MNQYIFSDLAKLNNDTECLKLINFSPYLPSNLLKTIITQNDKNDRIFVWKKTFNTDINNDFLNACYHGYDQILDSIFEDEPRNGENLIIKGCEIACKEGHIHIVNQLISQIHSYEMNEGVGLFYMLHKGLEGACLTNQKHVIEYLLELDLDDPLDGPEVCWQWNFEYGLEGACEGNNMELVKLMIKKGAKNWNRALQASCYSGDIKLTKFIIEKGGNDYKNVLNDAIFSGNTELVRLIMSYDDDFDLKEAFFHACGENKDIVELLEKKGKVDYIYGFEGACEYGQKEIMKMLRHKVDGRCDYCFEKIEDHF